MDYLCFVCGISETERESERDQDTMVRKGVGVSK